METNSALFPLYYFPPAPIVQRMLQYDQVYFDSEAPFAKQTYRNRMAILTANGVLQLSIPIRKGRSKQPMRDTMISYAENWTRVHLHAITSAYRKSPYFYLFEQELLAIYAQKPAFLADLNLALLQFTLRTLQGIKPPELLSLAGNSAPDGLLHLTDEDLETPTPLAPYPQVFEDRFAFTPGLSILDILCNEIYYFIK